MRDPDKRKRPRQTSLRGTEMAARTYIRAHLGWLRGLPTGQSGAERVPWETLPRIGSADAAEKLTVDRERLRATEYARNAVKRQFPKALQRVVGDVDAWSNRIDTQLAILKRCVHQGVAFPDFFGLIGLAPLRRSAALTVTAAARLHPRLNEIYAELVWLHWHDERALLSACAAVHPGALLALLDRTAVSAHSLQRVVALAADGTRPRVFDLLADSRIWDVPVPTQQLVAASRGCIEKPGHVASKFLTGVGHWPPPKLGPRLLKYALSLGDVDAKARNRQLRVLEVLLPDARLAGWEAGWQEASRIERHARRFDDMQRLQMTWDDLREYEALDTAARTLTLKPFDWAPLRAALPHLEHASPAFVTALERCLEHLDPAVVGYETVERFIIRWCEELSAQTKPILVQALSAVAELLAAMTGATAAKRSWVAQSVSYQFIERWLWSPRLPPRFLSPMLHALTLLVAPPRPWFATAAPFSDETTTWRILATLIEDGETSQAAAAAISAVPPHAHGTGQRTWLALWRVARGDVDVFAALARDWPNDIWDNELSLELGQMAKDPQVAAILAGAVSFKQFKPLARIASLSRLVRVLRLPQRPLLAAFTEVPPSFAAYPARLRPLLHDLAFWDPRAETAADEILGKDFPSGANIRDELSTLRAIVENSAPCLKKSSLEKRIAKLEQSLIIPVSISDRRLENLTSKLVRRVSHAALKRLDDTLLQTVQSGLSADLGGTPPESWLERPEVVRVLVGLPGLKRLYRTLALRLLGRTFHAPPWDLRDEPANHAFITRMGALGLNPDPWLDGIGSVDAVDEDRTLTLRLERDPVAVIGMGAPFDTCLAPGNFNFYSAIVNAADINKAVVFARDADGTIQGRCLLALSDDGHLLAFHIYAHRHSEALTSAFRTYAIDLAREIGATLSPGATIRPLHGTEWYDDGPNDLTGQFAFLEPGSPFLLDLASASPSEVVMRFQTALAGAAITPLVITRLNGLELFVTRPELIIPLLRHIGEPTRLDPNSLRRLIVPVRRAGDAALALAMLDIQAAEILRSGWGWGSDDTAAHLIELGQAQKALTLIRRTRPAGVHDWEDETEERIFHAAAALRAMGRPHRALEIARITERAASRSQYVVELITVLEGEIADARG